MSLDYPFYKELRRRKHRAAKWWRLGDALYYLGLIPAVILVLPALLPLPSQVAVLLPNWKTWVLSLLAFFVMVFLLGSWLKGLAWRMAKRDGIDVNDY